MDLTNIGRIVHTILPIRLGRNEREKNLLDLYSGLAPSPSSLFSITEQNFVPTIRSDNDLHSMHRQYKYSPIHPFVKRHLHINTYKIDICGAWINSHETHSHTHTPCYAYCGVYYFHYTDYSVCINIINRDCRRRNKISPYAFTQQGVWVWYTTIHHRVPS